MLLPQIFFWISKALAKICFPRIVKNHTKIPLVVGTDTSLNASQRCFCAMVLGPKALVNLKLKSLKGTSPRQWMN